MGTDQHLERIVPLESVGPLPHCVNCGYILRGLAIDGRCPECNTPVSLSLKDKPQRMYRPAEPVSAGPDVRCVRCGTPLGGLISHDDCPKCAAPIWLSLYGDWLCVRAPIWLRRVRRGMGLWVWALLVPFALYIIRFITPLIWADLWMRLWGTPNAAVYEVAINKLLYLLTITFELAAAFMITSGNPATVYSEPRLSLRRLIRALALAQIVLWVFAQLLYYLPLDMPEYLYLLQRILFMLMAAALLLGMIVHVRHLCRRLPNRKLERRLTMVLWGYVAYLVCDFVQLCVTWVLAGDGGMYLLISGALGGQMSWIAYMVLSFTDLLLFLVFSIWLAIILVRFRRALARIIAGAP
ncbi:MAG: hypothetical protein KAY37_15045 [Phycisphaerae bacterium]|nr:hypothetical protein [Phycisphaerae bacterium]